MRYVTFYYDLLRNHVLDLKVHEDKEKALKHFNSESHKWFEINTKFKATKLPATYGYPMMKYYGISARTFKKMFDVSVDEAVEIAKGRKWGKNDKGRSIKKAINIVAYFEAHFAKSKEAREEAANIIEALDQEPCEDTISRETVLNVILEDEYIQHHMSGDVWERIEDLIRDLPSIQPEYEWISLTEKSPEESDEYMITWATQDYSHKSFIGIAEYNVIDDYEGKWLLDNYITDSHPDAKVIAWMPLPERYKAESEG